MQGVHIATFASIAWETCTNSHHEAKRRPLFALSDTFAKTYGLQHRKAPAPSSTMLGPLEEINFTKIAIKFSRTLTKDVVFSGVRDLLQRIGELAGSGAQLSIAFNFGRLVAKNRVVAMVFDPVKVPRALLDDDVARSTLGSPLPSQLGHVSDFDIPPECVVDFATESHRWSDKEHAQVEPVTVATESMGALLTSRSNPENVISAKVLDAALSLQEELEMLDLLPHSPSSSSSLPDHHHRNGVVMESAFKRHVSSLADEVGLEAKYALEAQLQQRRDVDAIALETRTRRQNAVDMQRQLRVQMDHQRSARYSDKHEQKGIDPSASSFYCDSEQTRLGYEDASYRARTKQELKAQLLAQISGKEQERASDRQRSLQDDCVFLRRLRDEMDCIEQTQTRDRAEVRKTLTDSWRRDATIKKLVEAKKKHRAAEQQGHRSDLAVIAPSTGRASCLRPESLTPRFSRPRTGGEASSDRDFSVGFDIRSVCE